jgi:hypothetical protein
MKVKKVNKKIFLDLDEIIKFQIMMYTSLNNIFLSESEIKCLTELGKMGSINLTSFCNDLEDKDIFSSSQYGRNIINKLIKKKLISKKSGKKKEIFLIKDINIINDPNILLNITAIKIDESIQVKESV